MPAHRVCRARRSPHPPRSGVRQSSRARLSPAKTMLTRASQPTCYIEASAVRQWTKMTRSTADAFLNNRFDRRVVAPGTVGWIYEYTNRETLPIPEYVSAALELGVQLSGQWFHAGSRAGARVFTRGMVHTISPAERFTYAFKSPPQQASCLVGFTVYPAEVAELGNASLAFSPRAATRDARLFEL